MTAEVGSSTSVIRAFGEQERLVDDMCEAVDNQLKTGLCAEIVLRRWLVCRILFLWSFFTTSMYMSAMLNPGRVGTGTLGLCLAMLLLIEMMVEPILDITTGAQMEFISLARIFAYFTIPQEKPMILCDDSKYRSFSVAVSRRSLGRLSSQGEGPSLEISKGLQILLRASPCGRALVAADTGQLGDLCPDCEDLRHVESWHRLVAVGDAVRDVDAMAQELCSASSSSVTLEVQSGWLAGGARVEIDNLKAGYADIPRDVLKGISLTFEPKSKVGIVGTTGCGKSSLLLVLLRVLEPRAGRVLLNGVDTQNVGLATLRRTVGMVPQDPMLFAGTLRQNLDPLQQYTDGHIARALSLAQLSNFVEGSQQGLDLMIIEEGGNLSFGQRQMVCLARMVLRHPPLLLLDEATSAIDPNTQQLIQNTISAAFASSTLIAVAHRLETVLNFDHIVVMQQGDIVEQGCVKDLAQRKGGHLHKMLVSKRLTQAVGAS